MNRLERRQVLISIQRALLGMVYPEIRAIAVGFTEIKLHVVYYLDRKPNDDDYENIAEVTTEVFADINFNEVKEECIFTLEPLQLNGLDCFVYMRKEE
jgi:hypothetical protein